MRFVSELKHLYLNSSKKKFYSPVDVQNKKKGAAIFMLTPSLDYSLWLMDLPYMVNNNNFISYYLPKNVTAYIDSSNKIDEEEEVITEGLMVKNDKIFTLNFHNDYYYTARGIITDLFNYHYKEYKQILMVKDAPPTVDVYIYKDLDEFRRKTKITHAHSFSTSTSIHVVDVERYNGLDGTYKEYIRHEIAALLIKNINPKCHPTIVAYVAGSLSGQSENEDLMKRIDIVDASGCRTVDRIYESKGNRAVNRMIKTNDPSLLFKYGWIDLFNRIAQIYIGESTTKIIKNKSIDDIIKSYGSPIKEVVVSVENPSEFKQPFTNKSMYGYFNPDHDDKVHILDKKYVPKEYDYNKLMVHECTHAIIWSLNPKCSMNFIEGICIYESGQLNDYESVNGNIQIDYAKLIRSIVEKNGYDIIKDIISGKIKEPELISEAYAIVEGKLTTKERKELPDSEFGIPSKRAYPLNDESHVKSAIRMFNHVDESDEALLASRIISKMKSMDITDIQVSKENKFYKYYKKAFPKNIKESCDAPFGSIQELESQNYSFGEGFLRIRTEGTDLITFFEDSNDASHDTKLRRLLYKERIRTNKQQLQIYNTVKSMNPRIQRTYLRFEQYAGLNLFVDLHYYNQLFLQNNIMKMDKAVNMYWDFMNRLLENEEVNKSYSTKTYMIPIKGWDINDVNVVSDYKKSINPISVIFRMARTNPAALKEKWGNKIILFVGDRGYFRVDFSKFELKQLPRMKNNLRKLYSDNEIIEDEEDPDISIEEVDDKDTTVALAAKMVDKIDNRSRGRIAPTAIVGKNGMYTADNDTSLSDFTFYSDKAVIKNTEQKNSAIVIMAPHSDSAVSTIENYIKNPSSVHNYIRLDK